MKKSKTQKGITLVALIITIVVLMILAAVAISSIQNDGILSYAQNAASNYNQAAKNEQSMLQKYEDYLTDIDGEVEVYTVGQEVKVEVDGAEHAFYVIKDSGKTESKVLLLAKENIDTENLVQSSSANIVEFSETNYWKNDFTSSPYDITETGELDSSHYAAYAAYKYGEKLGGTGRLMIYAEAEALLNNSTFSSKLYETTYWLGSAKDNTCIWIVKSGVDYLTIADYDYDGDTGFVGVRPVVEIFKDKLS